MGDAAIESRRRCDGSTALMVVPREEARVWLFACSSDGIWACTAAERRDCSGMADLGSGYEIGLRKGCGIPSWVWGYWLVRSCHGDGASVMLGLNMDCRERW